MSRQHHYLKTETEYYQKVDYDIREFATDLNEAFADMVHPNGDIYRFYTKNKEYEANDNIPPSAIEETGTIKHTGIIWMRLNFD